MTKTNDNRTKLLTIFVDGAHINVFGNNKQAEGRRYAYEMIGLIILKDVLTIHLRHH